jgi:hypothetical protein
MKIRSLLATVTFSLSAHLSLAQNIVEYSTGAARAGAAAGGSGAGKAVGGVFRSLNKTLEQSKTGETAEPPRSSGEPKAGAAVIAVVSAPPKAAASAAPRSVKPEDVPVGMERPSLLEKFGAPLVKTAKMEGAAYLEIFFYRHPSEDMTVVTLRDGKVSSVHPPAAPAEGEKTAAP